MLLSKYHIAYRVFPYPRVICRATILLKSEGTPRHPRGVARPGIAGAGLHFKGFPKPMSSTFFQCECVSRGLTKVDLCFILSPRTGCSEGIRVEPFLVKRMMLRRHIPNISPRARRYFNYNIFLD